MFISVEFISGLVFGIEFIFKETLNEGKGWYAMLELGIIRVIIDK